MQKRISLAALLCLGTAHVALAQSSPGWISKNKNPGVGQIVTSDVVSAEFGVKADVNGGQFNNGTITSSTLFNSILTGATQAPTQPAGSNDQLVATDNYVDRAVATGLTLGKSFATSLDTIQCPSITVGASTTLTFPPQGDGCYSLTLSQANPSIIVGPTNPGVSQRLRVALSEPAGSSLPWVAPSSTSDVMMLDPAFVTTATANSTTTFDLVSYGDNRVFVPAGKTYGGAVALSYASAMSLDTPPQTIPGATITLTGTIQGGTPTAFDFSTNAFASSTLLSSPIITGKTYSVQVTGLQAGTYTLSLRDHNNPTASATSGTFVVSPWTPGTLVSSPGAYAVFATDPGNSALAQTSASGSLLTLASSINTAQYLIPQSGATNNPVLITRGQGADGKRRLVLFHPALTTAGIGDPGVNWLTCGNLINPGGYCGSGLLSLADSANNATSGSYTIVEAIDFDTSSADGLAGTNGFSWGTLGSPGPLSSVRNSWNQAANTIVEQISDVSGGVTSASEPATPGFHVITMIKKNGQITCRDNGQQVATIPVTATGATTFSGLYGDFTLGGSFQAGSANETGLPPPFMGDFQAYSGVLAGTDLSNAEAMAGNSVGLSLSPVIPAAATVATSISVGTIASAATNAPITVPFSYTGNTQAVAYSVNGGAWTPVTAAFTYNATTNNGTGTFSLSSGLAAGTYSIAVRDVNATSVSGASASFTVTTPITYAGTIVVATPSGVTPGSPIAVSVTYSGGTGAPQALQFAFDNSGSFTTVTGSSSQGNTVTFTTASGLPAGSHTIQVEDPNNPSSLGTSAAFTVAAPTVATSATSLTLASPAATTPGAAVTWTGLYGGTPTAIDYQLTPAGGSAGAWITPSTQSFNNGVLSFVMPSGNASASGVNTVQIRDHYTQSVTSKATFYASTWTETALATSPGASVVWSWNASNTTQVPLGSDGYIDQVNNAITPSQFLTPMFATSSTQRLLQETGAGNDGTHRAIGMSLVFGSDYASGDRAGNWLSAKAGGGAALINLANTTNVSTSGNFTVIEAGDMNTGLAVANIFAWGTAGTSPQYTQLQYLSSSGSVAAAIRDASGTVTTTGGSTSSYWHVYTMIKNGSTLTLRMDNKQVASATITSTAAFTASDFTIGAGFLASGTNPLAEYGGALSAISGFDAFSGVLQGTDLTNAEEKVGSTAGLHF